MTYPLNQYDKFVEERWFSTADPDEVDRAIMISTLGLNGEAGEVAEKIKKRLRGDIDSLDVHKMAEHRRQVAQELGDVLFYLTKLAHLHRCTLNEIAATNVEKLTSRTKRGVTRGDGDDR